MSIYFFSKINLERNKLNSPQKYIVCVADEGFRHVKFLKASKYIAYAKKQVDNLKLKSKNVVLRREFVNKGLKVYKYTKFIYLLKFKNLIIPSQVKKELSKYRDDFTIIEQIDMPDECTFGIYKVTKKNEYLNCGEIVHFIKREFNEEKTIRVIKFPSKIAILGEQKTYLINCKVNAHCNKLFDYIGEYTNNALFYLTPIKRGLICDEVKDKLNITTKDLYLSF